MNVTSHTVRFATLRTFGCALVTAVTAITAAMRLATSPAEKNLRASTSAAMKSIR